MKKYTFLPVVLLLLGIIVAGCDKIEPPYKEGGGGQVTDDTRKILLEDYTGHTCVNCPAGARLGHELVHLYNGKVIMIGIHAGYFAEPKSAPFNTDYRTEAGTAWDNYFGISAAGNPMGMVNRVSKQGAYNVTSANWATAVGQAAENKADISLEIKTTYNSSSRSLKVDLEAKALKALDSRLMIVACIIEDSIVSAQRNNDPNIGSPTIPDYTHRHVLRGSINTPWGEELAAAGQAAANASFTKSYTHSLNSDFNEKHVSVVAFIYDDTSKEVIQVEEKAIQ